MPQFIRIAAWALSLAVATVWHAIPAGAAPPTLVGSGFVVHPQGYVVTHRVAVRFSSKNLKIEDAYAEVVLGETSYEARVVAENEAAGLALLKIDAEDLPWLPIGDAAKIELGADVRAFGRPAAWSPEQSADLSRGMVSGVTSADDGSRLQIDADVKPGNAGGPYVNLRGEVVGVIGAVKSQSIAAQAVRTLLIQAGVTPPAAATRDEELSNVELAKRVAPSVAYVRTLVRRSALQTHEGPAEMIGLYEGQILITHGTAADPTVRFWDVASGALISTIGIKAKAGERILDAAFCAKTGVLAVIEDDGQLRVFVFGQKEPRSWKAFTPDDDWQEVPLGQVHVRAAISPDGTAVAAAVEDRVTIWDVNGRLLGEHALAGMHLYGRRPFALSAQAKQIAYHSSDRAQSEVRIYDVEKKEVTKSLKDSFHFDLSPDGRLMLVNGLGRIWDLNSGEVVEGDPGVDVVAALPSEGDLMLTAGSQMAGDNRERIYLDLWDRSRRLRLGRWLADDRSTKELFEHKPKSICASSDGLTAATSDESSGLAHLWFLHTDVARLPAPVQLRGRNELKTGMDDCPVRLSPRGDTAISWPRFFGESPPNSVLLLSDARTGATRLTVDLGSPDPPTPAYSLDGSRIAWAVPGADGGSEIRVAETSTGKVIRTLALGALKNPALGLSARGELLKVNWWISEGATQLPRCSLWDVETGAAWSPRNADGAELVLSGVTFSPDGAALVIRDASRRLTLWNAATRKLIRELDLRQRGPIGNQAFSQDGGKVAASVARGVLMWDAATGEFVREFDDPAAPADATFVSSENALSPRGDLLASCNARGDVLLWDVASARLLRILSNPTPLDGKGHAIVRLRFAPAGETLAVTYFAHDFPRPPRIVLWDVKRGTARQILSTPPGVYLPDDFQFSHDGKRLIVASDDGALRTHYVGTVAGPSAVVEGYLARAAQRTSDKRLEQAEADFSRAIELAPWRIDAYLARAGVRERRSKPAEVDADLTAVLELDPQNAGVYSRRAALRYDAKRYADAISDFDLALTLGRKNPFDLIKRGKCREALDRYPEAIEDYTAALRSWPTPILDAVLHRGLCYVKTKQWREALGDLQKAEAQVPDELKSEFAAAIQQAKAEVAKLPPLPPAATPVATPTAPAESPKPAARPPRMPDVSTPPGVRDVVVVLRDVQMEAEGRNCSILPKGTVFRVDDVQGTWLWPTEPRVRGMPGEFVVGWVPANSVEHVVNVFASLTRSIEANPHNAAALRERAALWMDVEEWMHEPREPKGAFDVTPEEAYRAALQDLAACLAVVTDDAAVYELRARALIELAWNNVDWQPEEFLSAYGAAVQLHRRARNAAGLTDVLLMRALVLSELGQTDDALRDVEELLRYKPDSARGYYARARIYETQKKTGEAERDYAQARRINSQIDKDPLFRTTVLP